MTHEYHLHIETNIVSIKQHSEIHSQKYVYMTKSQRESIPIQQYSFNRSFLGSTPPTISETEKTLHRKTRSTLAQLRSGFSCILQKYLSRIDECLSCSGSPHDVEHLFNCAAKPMTLVNKDLWTNPVKVSAMPDLATND